SLLEPAPSEPKSPINVFNSGIQEPQLVPQRSCSPRASALLAPFSIARIMSFSPTSKQEQISLPLSSPSTLRPARSFQLLASSVMAKDSPSQLPSGNAARLADTNA